MVVKVLMVLTVFWHHSSRKSYEKILNNVIEEQVEIYGMEPNMEKAREIAWKRTRKEVKDGIQTIQYQINTLMTTNGQSPICYIVYVFPTRL